MAKELQNIKLEGAKIVFRNFSGKEGKFNRAGDKNFCVIIPTEMVDELLDEGWNLKQFKPREDDEEEPDFYLPVKVKYGKIEPKIVMVLGKKQTPLDEESVSTLDFAEIENVDLIIRPYSWEMNGKVGVTAYVKTMYVVIAEDEFSNKYSEDEDEMPWEP